MGNGSNDEDFYVDWSQVADEVGNDLVENNKFLDFASWLYGPEYQQEESIKVRYAPSIIARSESELFGISSPRFAFRAYIGAQGIATIRRRTKTLQSLRASGLSENAVNLLVDEPEGGNWLADCLLSVPDRFPSDQYNILTSDLRQDYGEDFPEASTAFVTHADVGGGLCAQAACFMALCLAPTTTKIFGIAEITRSALADPRNPRFRISGLNVYEIKKFIDDPDRLGVSAQRQGLELRYTDDHELESSSVARVAKALRAYIRNQVPVIQIASLSRMRGVGAGVHEPIVEFGDEPVDFQNFQYIPLGFKPQPPTEDPAFTHSIVIVGCSDETFVINDPASFPFIETSDQNLVNAAPITDPSHRPLVSTRIELDPNDLPDQDMNFGRKKDPRHLYECFSVTPPNVELALLRTDFALERKQKLGPNGLFDRVDEAIVNSRIYSVMKEGGIKIAPSLQGEYYLLTWQEPLEDTDGQGTHVCMHATPDDSLSSQEVIQYLAEFPRHDFWAQRLDLDKQGTVTRTLWLWGATDLRPEKVSLIQYDRYPYSPKIFELQGQTWTQVDALEK